MASLKPSKVAMSIKDLPFCVVDFETYYDDEFSLRKMNTTEYVRDPRFKVQCVAIRHSDEARSHVYAGDDVAEVLRSIDWRKTAFAAHHCQFDAFIAHHHFGIEPVMYFDSLSMSRALFGVDARHSLNDVCERILGRISKFKGAALSDVKGVLNLTDAQLERLAEYAHDDANDTYEITKRMLGHMPEDELQLIDLTVRMYAQPVLYLDFKLLEEVEAHEIRRKQELLERVGLTADVLSSNDKFVQVLEGLGVDVPYKVSPRTGLATPALAKNDLAFKELLAHPDETVRAVMEARVGVKSTTMQTRASALAARGRKAEPTPIYLNYWGARTGRWSGGDGVNFQNMPRKSKLRESLMAPEGYVVIAADQSQIEARMNAWKSGHSVLLDAFARGDDVYCLTASDIYGFPVNAKDHPDERFVGKTFVLGAGYGAGASKIHYMLRVGQFGPPVDITLEEVQRIVDVWRVKNAPIVQYWRTAENMLRQAFLGGTTMEDGPIAFEGHNGDGFIHMPNGSFIRYSNVRMDDDSNIIYDSRQGVRKLYGGLIVENIIQALARRTIGDNLVQLAEQLDDRFLPATTTHDEIIGIARKRDAERVVKEMKRIMRTAPDWAPDIPLDVKVSYAERYTKD